MKKIYILACATLFGMSVNAQSFVYSTDQHITDVLVGTYNVYDISFATPSPEGITFEWETISNTLPVEWDLSICDYTNCYVGVPASGIMTNISLSSATAGVEGFLKLNANAQGVNGNGTLTMYVYDANDYARGDTVSWFLSYDLAGLEDQNLADAYLVYPNPATDVLNIEGENITSLTLFNSLGQMVFTSEELTNSINLSSFNTGVYFVAIENQAGTVTNKRVIIQ